MVPTLLAAAAAVVLRSLTGVPLQRLGIGAPLVMVVAGALVGLTVEGSVGAILNTGAAQTVAEVVLAVLLFVDASEVRGGRLWGSHPRVAARLLLLALPLSLVLAVGVGTALFPELSLPVLLVLACVVMPVDFAASESVLRERRLAPRLRSPLNVEGGYNDGILSPLFLFALALAGGTGGSGGSHGSPMSALTSALPHAAIAVAVGFAVGALLGAAIDQAAVRGWAAPDSRRVVVLLAPLLAYTAALALSGNGFVSAFVAGIAFRAAHGALAARRARQRRTAAAGAAAGAQPARVPVRAEVHADYALLEDVTSLLTTTMWFVVGIAGVYLAHEVDLPVLAFCALALTLLRVVPVLVAMVGAPVPFPERVLAGLLGPRGTTTIVFGLLAFNRLPDGLPADTILITTLVCVLGSVVLHGLGSSWAISRFSTAREPAREPARAG
jgi:sodium/hydrogen antiporter